MKFNILSDLHLEFEKPKILGGSSLSLPGGEVLLIAGDLGIASRPESYVPFLEEQSKKYDKIYFVMGNHEHYGGDFDTSFNDIRAAIYDLKNVVCLNNNYVELDDDTILIGSTLWSDIDKKYEYQIASGMNDFRIVDNLTTTIARHEFRVAKQYIEDKLKQFEDKKVIVMTHHAPTLKVPEIYRGNALNSAYGSDLTELLFNYWPEYWIHGHTHVSCRYSVEDTTILCNPRGYVGHEENSEFDVNLMIEL